MFPDFLGFLLYDQTFFQCLRCVQAVCPDVCYVLLCFLANFPFFLDYLLHAHTVFSRFIVFLTQVFQVFAVLFTAFSCSFRYFLDVFFYCSFHIFLSVLNMFTTCSFNLPSFSCVLLHVHTMLPVFLNFTVLFM